MNTNAINSMNASVTLMPRTYRVEEIAKILGIGRSAAYQLVKEGQFNTVRIGSSIRVSRRSFDAWLDRQTV